ncbi:GntR family transcriptional regulator [Aeromicrobium sp.]|uniref:GntR family transcriptional regulator n=1 Tax=Aeromicrobium sp. TaxID=1871063 RepID=UPI0028AA1562|nr:GntR family transcriptional regulator [Aeromicrobium sp.]
MTARPTATDRVFALLRERIVGGDLAAGSQHSIYRLAEQLEVSRTPVREAVLRLADLGLVEIERNRGVRVRSVTAADVREVFELRLLLEVPAAAGAAVKADDTARAALASNVEAMRAHARTGSEADFTAVDRDFHALVAAAMRNPRLEAEVARLRDSIQARGVSTFGRSRPLSEVAGEHAPIADAILRAEPAEAAAAMAGHLERTATLLMRQVAIPGDEVDEHWAADVRAALGAAGE